MFLFMKVMSEDTKTVHKETTQNVTQIFKNSSDRFGVLAEIPTDSFLECGKYCQFVSGCKTMMFKRFLCTLYNSTLPENSSDANNKVTIDKFYSHRCQKVNHAVLNSEKFSIESIKRTLYFSEEIAGNSDWKRYKALFWVYNTSTQQLRAT